MTSYSLQYPIFLQHSGLESSKNKNTEIHLHDRIHVSAARTLLTASVTIGPTQSLTRGTVMPSSSDRRGAIGARENSASYPPFGLGAQDNERRE